MKKYDWIGSFYDGFAQVKINNKYGFINQEGQEICPCKYKNSRPFINGFAVVMLDGKYGFINEQGIEICDIKYDDVWNLYNKVWNFENGFARVEINNKEGFIDNEGNEYWVESIEEAEELKKRKN